MMKLRAIATTAVCSAALSLSCAKEPELKPAAGASTVRSQPDVIQRESNGVHIRVQAWPWKGDAQISEEVTPLRVVIQNDSDQAIAIRYDDFKLISGEDEVYRALPLYDIEGTVPVYEEFDEGPLEPRSYAGFKFAPYHSRVNRALEVHEEGDVHYDRDFYTSYQSWPLASLPTQNMQEAALPEGLLARGGRVAGYLFFEKVRDDERHLEFRAEFGPGPMPSPNVASLQVPLTMK